MSEKQKLYPTILLLKPMTETLKELIRKELVIDEEKALKEIISRVKKFLKLTNEGKIVFTIDRSRLPKLYHILLYLIGKRLAYIADLTTAPEATIQELSKELGFAENYTRALLSELSNKDLIKKSEKDQYTITIDSIEKVLTIIESRIGER